MTIPYHRETKRVDWPDRTYGRYHQSYVPLKSTKKNVKNQEETWRIIPFSRWLVTPSTSHKKGHLEGVPQPDP